MDFRAFDGSVHLGYGLTPNDSDPPLLLLPPLGRDRSSWRAQAPFLAEHYRTITPDTRGTGTSRDALDGFTIDQFATDALVILDELGVGEVHVAGWSMGAAVAMELAIQAPDRVRSLSLYTPWARTDADLEARFLVMRELTETGSDLVGVEEHTLRLILSPEALAGIPDLREAAAAATRDPGYPSRKALIGHLDASIAHDVLEALGAVACPALVVGGEHDALTPACLARQVAASIPGAEYVEMSGSTASHALPLELADDFNALARDFLDRH
ncbi:MAG: alpha/beta hydrolase [Actinomycetota bacterium]|nr:alpha/beta hydrolase [Actinomycetota bacterium]